jgi:hypothetical protein
MSRRFFLYQIANVYLMLFSGSVFNALDQAISNPASIIPLIGKALPTVSNFFLNYTITSLLSGIPLMMLNVVPLLVYKIYRSCFSEHKITRRTFIEGPLAPSSINYGLTLPGVLYPLCIFLTYWVISPILLAVGALLFGGLLLGWKYQLLYIVVPNYESGGAFFYGLFNYSMIGLMASTITGIAFMAIKEGAAQAPLMIPLPFIILHAWRKCDETFLRLSTNLPYSMAVHDDIETSDQVAALIANFQDDFLRQPEFSECASAKPYPHRINGTPLLDNDALLNHVYWDLPENQSEMQDIQPSIDDPESVNAEPSQIQVSNV